VISKDEFPARDDAGTADKPKDVVSLFELFLEPAEESLDSAADDTALHELNDLIQQAKAEAEQAKPPAGKVPVRKPPGPRPK
jgi:hypothetical protein